MRFNADRIRIQIEAPFHHDPAPDSPIGPTDRLWEHEVIELFLVHEGTRYTELEFGPHGHWLALRLDGVRQIVDRDLPLKWRSQIDGDRWRGEGELMLSEPVVRWNAFAIHGVGAARRYLAAHPVGGDAPDFHRIEQFPLLQRNP